MRLCQNKRLWGFELPMPLCWHRKVLNLNVRNLRTPFSNTANLTLLVTLILTSFCAPCPCKAYHLTLPLLPSLPLCSTVDKHLWPFTYIPGCFLPHLSWQRSDCPLSSPTSLLVLSQREVIYFPLPVNFRATKFQHCPSCSPQFQITTPSSSYIRNTPSRFGLYPSCCCFQQSAWLPIYILWALWNPTTGTDDFCAQEHE